MKKFNIIFMGTAEFAIPALQILAESEQINVRAVFTSPPKAKGRGMKIIDSPIAIMARDYNIDVFTPSSLKSSPVEDLITSIAADVIVVVAYGLIVPSNILKAKKYGCLNVHPSMLPRHRGAAPLQRTIINGDKQSGVCVIQMDAGLDTGDIILQENFPLSERITFQELHDKCAHLGADLIMKVIHNIDHLPRRKQQEESGATYAHKLTKEEGKVNWNETSFQIDCKVRGMNPWPGVYFQHHEKKIKIINSQWTDKQHHAVPGQIIGVNDFEVACGKGSLIIERLKPEGKAEIKGSDYLRGVNSKDILFDIIQ